MRPLPDLGVPATLRAVRVAVPLRTPHVWAGGATAVRDVLLVRWTRPDGVVGWGECPTLDGYVTGGTDVAWSAARPAAERLVTGADVPAASPTALVGAFADAALDAALRAADRSLLDQLGGSGTSVRCGAVVGPPDGAVDDVVAAARRAVAAGAALVKLKVGPATEPATVAAVVSALDPVPVAVDANGTLDTAVLPDLDRLGLAYVEDPVAVAGGWDGLAAALGRCATPWVVDEPVRTALDVDDLLRSAAELGPARPVVSVKPSRLGGVWAAWQVANRVVAAGGRCVVGGMVELGVHRAGAAALAAAVADLPGTFPTDLGPSARYVEVDVAGPVEVDDRGRLLVPEGPGNGVVPDAVALARWTVDEFDV